MKGAYGIVCNYCECGCNLGHVILIKQNSEVIAFGEIDADACESLASSLFLIAQKIRAEDGEPRVLNA